MALVTSILKILTMPIRIFLPITLKILSPVLFKLLLATKSQNRQDCLDFLTLLKSPKILTTTLPVRPTKTAC